MDPITRFIYATSGGAKGPFDCQFLVIGGGGSPGAGYTNWWNGGGGAGGYITSWDPNRIVGFWETTEYSGGNSTASNELLLAPNTTYSVTIGAGASNGTGAAGSDSYIQGTDDNGNYFMINANGGGVGGGAQNGGSGGSGGGAGIWNLTTYQPGQPSAGQGFQGGSAIQTGGNQWSCNNYGGSNCWPSQAGTGGGGGAGGTPGFTYFGAKGGDGQLSTITGSSVYRASGGHGQRSTITGSEVYRASGGHGWAYNYGPPSGYNNINGYASDGSGGNANAQMSQNGRIYLRYPKRYTLTNPGGGLSFQSGWTGGYTSTTENCTEILSGTGNIEFI